MDVEHPFSANMPKTLLCKVRETDKRARVMDLDEKMHVLIKDDHHQPHAFVLTESSIIARRQHDRSRGSRDLTEREKLQHKRKNVHHGYCSCHMHL